MTTRPSDEKHRIDLPPLQGAPFMFTAAVTERSTGGVTIEVAAEGGGTFPGFHLKSRDHADYRALFAALSDEYGTRAPRTGEAVSSTSGSGPGPFRLLLKEAIHPGIPYGYGDPAVTRLRDPREGKDFYYLLVTSNDAADAFPILRSRDIEHWDFRGHVFPQGRAPGWTAVGPDSSDFWAPELHEAGGRYVLCFTARDRGGALCIGLAFADHPEGPYEAAAQPLLDGGVIDPHLFSEKGRSWLYWKQDSNDLWPGLLAGFMRGHPCHIAPLFPAQADARAAALAATLWPWVQTLQPMERFLAHQMLIDAVAADVPAFRASLEDLATTVSSSATREAIHAILAALRTPILMQELDTGRGCLIGEPVTVLSNDLAWEAHLIEGVWVTAVKGRFYLFYAGNDFSTPDYGIGVASAECPEGPFIKSPEPFLRSTQDWWGPGHPSVAAGPDGTPMLFLHAFPPGRTGYKAFRALLSVALRFEGDTVKPVPL